MCIGSRFLVDDIEFVVDVEIDFVGGIRGMQELERRVAEGMEVELALYPTSIHDVMSVADFVDLLTEMVPGAQITFDSDTPLPVDADLDDSGLRKLIGEIQHTPLRTSITQDIAAYRSLVEADKIDLTQLDR